jgi:hypothetical protein
VPLSTPPLSYIILEKVKNAIEMNLNGAALNKVGAGEKHR